MTTKTSTSKGCTGWSMLTDWRSRLLCAVGLLVLASSACVVRAVRGSSTEQSVSKNPTTTDHASAACLVEKPVYPVQATVGDGTTGLSGTSVSAGYLFPRDAQAVNAQEWSVGILTWPELQAVATNREEVGVVTSPTSSPAFAVGDGGVSTIGGQTASLPNSSRAAGVYSVPTSPLAPRWYALKLSAIPTGLKAGARRAYVQRSDSSFWTLFRVGSAPQLSGIAFHEPTKGRVPVRLRFSEPVSLPPGDGTNVVVVRQGGVSSACQMTPLASLPVTVGQSDGGTAQGMDAIWHGECEAFDPATEATVSVTGDFKSAAGLSAAGIPFAMTYKPSSMERSCGAGCWDYNLFAEAGPR